MARQDLYQDLYAYLKKQPKSQERNNLLASVAVRLPKPEPKQRPCKINFAIPSTSGDLDRRYPFFARFMRDGYICAGCGGNNDRGHGGHLGDLCWNCWDIEQQHECAEREAA